MAHAIKLTAPILPGRRVEFTAPELPESGTVELTVVFQDAEEAEPKEGGVLDFLRSLKPVERTPEEWAAVERELREEKDSWDF